MPLIVETAAGDMFVDATDADGSKVIINNRESVLPSEMTWQFFEADH